MEREPDKCGREDVFGVDPMKTVEEVERSLGLEGARHGAEFWGSGCSYNPKIDDDPAGDCNHTATWHFKTRGGRKNFMMLACDVHQSRLLAGPYRDALLDWHECGSACGLEGSWWISLESECGSLCVTEERGVELGYLKYIEDDRGRPD